MHRSGTSALAGALHKMGYDIGQSILKQSIDNPTGFFENQKVVAYNDKLLAKLSMNWQSTHPLPSHWESLLELNEEKEELLRLIEAEFDASNDLCIKDPRISLLLPIWKLILKDHYDLKSIIIHRDPVHVIQSLHKRNKFSSEKSNLIWLNYYHGLISQIDKNDQSSVISFQELLEGKSERLISVLQEIGLNPELTRKDEIDTFLNKKQISKLVANEQNEVKPEIKRLTQAIHTLLTNNLKSENNKKAQLLAEVNDLLTTQENKEQKSTAYQCRLLVYNGDQVIDSLVKSVKYGVNVLDFDLSGIDKFTSLTFLPCSDHSIFSLISVMSGDRDITPSATINSTLLNYEKYCVANENSYLHLYQDRIGPVESLGFRLQFISIGRYAIDFLPMVSGKIDQLISGLESEILKEKNLAREEQLKAQDLINQKANRVTELETANKYLEQSKDNLTQEISNLHAVKGQVERNLSESKVSLTELSGHLKSLDNKNEELNNRIKQIGQQNENLVSDKQKIYDHMMAVEGDKANIKSSLSYRLGRVLTWPIRFVYDLFAGDLPLRHSKFWLFISMGLLFLRHPIRSIKNFSPDNVKKLKSALGNENPKNIANNFKKLVSDNKEDSDIHGLYNVIKADNQRKNVLFISPHLPDYDQSSGGKRATRMLGLLAEDCNVYAFTLGNKPASHVAKLNELNVNVFDTKDFEQVKESVAHFDAIIFAWFYTIFDCDRFLQLYPEARIIMDTVDVHWVREERSIGLTKSLTKEKVAQNKKLEIEAYQKADVIWAVTENDKHYLHQELPEKRVEVVSNIHDIEKTVLSEKRGHNILFFGGYNHYPNISAVKVCAEKILPLVRKEIPDAQLIIAGSNALDDVVALSKKDGVVYKGFIEESDIDQLYESTGVCAVPLLAGAGIKGKICEAIAYKVPVVTNAIGNEGINLVSGEEGFVTEDYDAMAKHIVDVFSDKYDLDDITSRAQKKLLSIVGAEKAKTNMLRSIHPEITICIVTWNRLELLQRCIESVEQNTTYPYYKIVVHSNGCEDGTKQYLNSAKEINPRIIPILSETNDVFVKPNNAMMDMYPLNDVVLLNNDTYVKKDWLTNLYKVAYSDPDIGIVGSKILYPDGTLQEFGSELYEDGTGRNIGKWDDPDKREYNIAQRVGYVSGCSMFIKRATIDKIGTFDEQFHPCYCEDSDLCYTAWENDIQTVVTPESIIYHDEGGTSGTDENTGFKRYQKVNFEKFLKKHKKNLGHISKEIKRLNKTTAIS